MDIESIKIYRKKYYYICGTYDPRNLGELPVIDWLIAEVDRLNDALRLVEEEDLKRIVDGCDVAG